MKSAFVNAADLLRHAITYLRRAGQSENNGELGEAISALERIHTLCVDRAKSAPKVSAPIIAAVLTAPAPAPSATVTVSSPASQDNTKPGARIVMNTPNTVPVQVAAQTAPATVKHEKPSRKDAERGAKGAGLREYSDMRKQAKAMGIDSTGTKAQLKARIEAHKANPQAAKPQVAANTAPRTISGPQTVLLTVERSKAEYLTQLSMLSAEQLKVLCELAK